MKLQGKKIISLILPSLFMLYLELYLRMKAGLWANSAAMNAGALIAAAAFGLGLCMLFSLTKFKCFNKWFALIITEFCCAWYSIQYFTDDSYSAFMSPASIFTGASGVIEEFGDAIISILKGNWDIILMFQLPVIALLILNITGFTYFKRDKGSLAGLLVLCIFASSISKDALTCTKLAKEKASYAFVYDDAMRFLGTFASTGLELKYSLTGVPEPLPEPLPEPEPEPEPSPQDSGYKGYFEGKNLIMITAESLSKELVESGYFPLLSMMANRGIVIEDYYQPFWGGSTTSGEASVLLGLIPTDGANTMQKIINTNNSYTLASMLREHGYYTAAYHNGDYDYYKRYKTHPALGFTDFVAKGTGMEKYLTHTWPGSDAEMFDCIPDMFIGNAPFYAYIMTYSGHGLYNFTGHSLAIRHKELVADRTDLSTQVRAYIAGSYELELGLESLINSLSEAQQLENTVFVITSDHYPYALQKGEAWKNKEDHLKELYGYAWSTVNERDHSVLIIWSPCLEELEETIHVDAPCYSPDITPTLLNLFGIDYDASIYAGRNILSDEKPLVVWNNSSWLTDIGFYDSSNGTFTIKDGAVLDDADAYIKQINSEVHARIARSREIINKGFNSKLQ